MKSHALLFFVIVLATCLTQFASDVYAPSLPNIASNLSVNVDLVQWSMAIYMLGVALSQLAYGPLSEGVGRKKPLLAGLIIMLIGGLVCFFAKNIETLILGRLIQGCGAGACAALWRSIFRDIFTGEELAKYGSYLVVFVMFIVPAAPVLGGYLQDSYGWRACFAFMSIYTVVALFAIARGFKETNKHHHIERLKLSYIVKTYSSLLISPVFMGITLCTFLSYGAFFTWFVSGPVLLIEGIGISPVAFGWITFSGGGTAYALAGWLNGRVVKRFGMPTMLRFGWCIMIVASSLLLVSQLVFNLTLWGIVIPVILFYFGSTFIWPNAFAMAFTPFGKIAGYAGALYGSMQLGGAAALGGLMSYLPNETPLSLGLVMLGASVSAWLIYEYVVTTQKLPMPPK